MAKISAKNAVVLIGGYNFSTYAMSYEAKAEMNPFDVTGFGDGSHNFLATQKTASISANMLWDAAANKVHAGLGGLPSAKHVTIIPEGYTLGNATLSMPFMEGNYNPSGSPSTAISIGNIEFSSYGDNAGLEDGYALAHETITVTTTGTGFDDLSGAAVTAICAGTIHVWTPTTTDTYVVKIQHSTTFGSGYADLITFTLNGTARNSERITVASGTVNRYRRVLSTRTGSANDPFGYSVHFWHA